MVLTTSVGLASPAGTPVLGSSGDVRPASPSLGEETGRSSSIFRSCPSDEEVFPSPNENDSSSHSSGQESIPRACDWDYDVNWDFGQNSTPPPQPTSDQDETTSSHSSPLHFLPRRRSRSTPTPSSISRDIYLASTTLHRRRSRPEEELVSTSSSSSTPHQRRRRRPSNSSRSSSSFSSTRSAPPLHHAASNTILSSLDSGMAALSRWIRSRRTAAPPPREDVILLDERDIFAQMAAGGRDWNSTSSLEMRLPSSTTRRRNRDSTRPVFIRPRRQRAHSEPDRDRDRVRNTFFRRQRASNAAREASSLSSSSEEGGMQLQGVTLFQTEGVPIMSGSSSHSNSSNNNVSNNGSSNEQQTDEDSDAMERATTISSNTTNSPVNVEIIDVPPQQSQQQENATTRQNPQTDPEGMARMRWIRINQRLHFIITMVALIFSLLLFAILVCWVVFTSAYVVSIDKICDVPLKSYFWLATLELILDVFRTDIMRLICRYDARSQQRIPKRVILYNVAYLTYAMLILRMGIKSVFLTKNAQCPKTAPELFQTSRVFVSLSIAAWSTIIFGYLVPFCLVIVLLTRNGYSPTIGLNPAANAQTAFFPGPYNAAPPECIDRLRVVLLEEFPEEYPRDCCICMTDFVSGEVIVVTECEHVFHKRCCQEWLRQARTCPVCRSDIPESLGLDDASDGGTSSGRERRFGPEELRPENVQNAIMRMLRRGREERENERGEGEDGEEEVVVVEDVEEGQQQRLEERLNSSIMVEEEGRGSAG